MTFVKFLKMALLFQKNINSDVVIGIWRIEESVEELSLMFPHLDFVISQYGSLKRKQEVLCTYALLYQMTGNEKLLIEHGSLGNPLVSGFFISISHTKGFVSLILSKYSHVSIDIEYKSKRVFYVEDHFIRKDEAFKADKRNLLTIWCTKETYYKYRSSYFSERISMLQMKVEELTLSNNHGKISVVDYKNNCRKQVFYEINSDYTLTYICK